MDTKHGIQESRQLVRSIMATGAIAVGLGAAVVFGLVPSSGGMVGGTTIVIDNSAGDQIDPHVSGNIAAYTDDTAGVIRYYDFSTSTLTTPVPPAGSIDGLSDVNGNHISFVRQTSGGQRACMVFDMSSGTTIQIGPSDSRAFQTALGGDTVAFVSDQPGSSDIMVGKISAPAAPLVNISASPDLDASPAVSPSGDAVVWSACPNYGLTNCRIMKSIFSGGTWTPPEVVWGAEPMIKVADTDGNLVVYDSDRPSSITGADIYFQPLSGGGETQLQLAGVQRTPRISDGVIAFGSVAPGASKSDLFVYVTATNTLWQVTNTPDVGESLNDITVLPNGDVRVVWTGDDDTVTLGDHNIYARTFTIPLTACEPVTLNVNPTTIRRGATGTINAAIRSCSSTPYHVAVSLAANVPILPSCTNQSVGLGTLPFTLTPGFSRSISFPFRVPAAACVGTYNMTATTTSPGLPTRATSATVTIIP